MVRAPCCDKMGLKKGPWTFEEDRILINYINQYGHGNWRALPKQAGLLRCGKSCRLRWMNYLRPDIKRGNFSREEEETIMKLHEMLGNRWSTIAAKLPGRTDNEIKNVWHTHLKKRLKQNHATMENNDQIRIKTHSYDQITYHEEPTNYSNQGRVESPQHSASCTDTSATTTTTTNEDGLIDNNYFPEVDEKFWSEVFQGEYTGVPSGIPAAGANPQADHIEELFYDYYSSMQDGTDFWFNLFTTSERVV